MSLPFSLHCRDQLGARDSTKRSLSLFLSSQCHTGCDEMVLDEHEEEETVFHRDKRAHISSPDVYSTSGSTSASPYACATDAIGPSDEESYAVQEGNTMSDVGSQGYSEVCLGMLLDVGVLPQKITKKAPLHSNSHTGGGNLSLFNIEIGKDACYLTQHCGLQIGVIDSRTENAIRELDTHSRARLQGHLPCQESIRDDTEPRQSKNRSTTQPPPDLRSYSICMNIFAPSDQVEAIGKILDKHHLYLQTPDYLDPSIAYSNPHYFSLTDEPAPLKLNVLPDSNQQLIHQVNELLNTACTPEAWSEIEPDPRIRTTLLSHQKKGLYFMTVRETGVPAPGESSVWAEVDFFGTKSYENRITLRKTSELPKENKGGIIADDMGMGKTLMMLSLILHSQSQAREYSTPIEEENMLQQSSITRIQGTLIIGPKTVITGWAEEIQRHVEDGGLAVHIYHGSRKAANLQSLAQFDVVITTYQTLVSEWEKEKNLLHGVSWFRIVLDEAHTIRHPSTRQFLATLALRGERRWALTGTPVQNRLDDLTSLTRFIQYPSSSDAKEFFKENISMPLKNHDITGFDNLRRLMHSICIRRSKDSLNLPERNLHIVDVALTPSESIEYERIKTEARNLLEKTTITSGKGGKGYFNILQLILKLRLFCNLGLSLSRQCATASLPALEEEGDTTCISCNLETQDREYAGRGQVVVYVTACSHVFCSECFPEYKAALSCTPGGSSVTCPLCTATLPQQHFIKERLPAKAKQKKSDGGKGFQSVPASPEPELSSKVNALLGTLFDLRAGQAPSKSVVFSCWTRTLDYLESVFIQNKIVFARLDGTLTLDRRNIVLTQFRSDPAIEVLMMSISTGAEGINLTTAHNVHLLEPQWNPMVEEQAIARVHRYGQKRNTNVFRYVSVDTIETDVLLRQRKKIALAGSLSETCQDAIRTRLADLKALF